MACGSRPWPGTMAAGLVAVRRWRGGQAAAGGVGLADCAAVPTAPSPRRLRSSAAAGTITNVLMHHTRAAVPAGQVPGCVNACLPGIIEA